MTRTLRQLKPDERDLIVLSVHEEAEGAGWSRLSHQKKGEYYRQWETKYNLSHATLKDRILKGFDARQGIPKTGEAKIQAELIELFKQQGMYVKAPYSVWTGAQRIDLLLGFSEQFPTHAIEVERADTWAEGLRQALWYRAAVWHQHYRQVLPTLILFGNATAARFQQIVVTCQDAHVALLTWDLTIDGQPETEHSVMNYLRPQLPLQVPTSQSDDRRRQIGVVPVHPVADTPS